MAMDVGIETEEGYCILPDEEATTFLGGQGAAGLQNGGLVVYLYGEQGAGKTSFARAFLAALGVGERIKSPTYSLVETYRVCARTFWHMDLYRIADPGELEWLGLDSLFEPASVVLVEWPEHGHGVLPPPDMCIYMSYAALGRRALLQAKSARGRQLLQHLRASRLVNHNPSKEGGWDG